MEEAVVKRVMPHSNEAEQAVIGFITNNMALFLRL